MENKKGLRRHANLITHGRIVSDGFAMCPGELV
jgi:hypothetical protein